MNKYQNAIQLMQSHLNILNAHIANGRKAMECIKAFEQLDHIPDVGEMVKANEPLSLSKLRWMAGKPVYMVYSIRRDLDGWMLSDETQDYVDEVEKYGATAYRCPPNIRRNGGDKLG